MKWRSERGREVQVLKSPRPQRPTAHARNLTITPHALTPSRIYKLYTEKMSVGFGFSAGDFIAALNLVGTVASALRDSRDASGQFAELVAHLDILEKALIEVNNLDLEDAQIA